LRCHQGKGQRGTIQGPLRLPGGHALIGSFTGWC
jgi:hypothetical protein